MVATETKFALGGMLLVFAASALGGLRWALTQMLLTGHGGHGAAVPNAATEVEEKEEEPMGLDNPCATIYWLAPTMAVTLFILCAIVDGLGNIFASKYVSSLAYLNYQATSLWYPCDIRQRSLGIGSSTNLP